MSEGVLKLLLNRDLSELGFDLNRYPITKLQYPLTAFVIYLVTITSLSPKPKTHDAKKTKPDRKSQSSSSSIYTTRKLIENIVISAHNLGLCIFSLLCLLNTAPIAYKLWISPGWTQVICSNSFLGDDTWWYWTYLFYLSKYYEFVDTYILVYKGKQPSFLQKFHHVGAVLSMWIIITTHSHTAYVFVIPNSFIHSIMYLYYAASVWKIKVPCKWILTRMQMIQFCLGLFLGLIELYHWDCQTFPDKLSIVFNAVYVPTLLVLFNLFYHNTYKKKQ